MSASREMVERLRTAPDRAMSSQDYFDLVREAASRLEALEALVAEQAGEIEKLSRMLAEKAVFAASKRAIAAEAALAKAGSDG